MTSTQKINSRPRPGRQRSHEIIQLSLRCHQMFCLLKARNQNECRHFTSICFWNHSFSLEPRSSLAQQQECPSQKLSIPVSSSTSQKQLHIELTQRLQKVLSERNQGPAPREPSTPRRKLADLKEGSKGRNSAVQSDLGLCTSKEQQTRTKALSKGKRQRLMSPEADAAVIKAPAKTSTAKALQKRVPPQAKVGNDIGRSNKETVCILYALSILRPKHTWAETYEPHLTGIIWCSYEALMLHFEACFTSWTIWLSIDYRLLLFSLNFLV